MSDEITPGKGLLAVANDLPESNIGSSFSIEDLNALVQELNKSKPSFPWWHGLHLPIGILKALHEHEGDDAFWAFLHTSASITTTAEGCVYIEQFIRSYRERRIGEIRQKRQGKYNMDEVRTLLGFKGHKHRTTPLGRAYSRENLSNLYATMGHVNFKSFLGHMGGYVTGAGFEFIYETFKNELPW